MEKIEQCKVIIRQYHNDRLFSQLMRHLLSFLAAKHFEKKHIHWPYQDQFNEEKIFEILDRDLVTDETVTVGYSELMRASSSECLSLPDQSWMKLVPFENLFSETNIDLIRKAYKIPGSVHTKERLDPRVEKRFKVSLHIRRGDLKSCWISLYNRMSFFVDTVELVVDTIATDLPIVFFIYSDSDISDEFNKLLGKKRIYCRYKFIIEGDLLESLNDMVSSDLLVLSFGSNFSYFAGMVNKNIVYYDEKMISDKLGFCTNHYFKHNKNWICGAENLEKRLETILSN